MTTMQPSEGTSIDDDDDAGPPGDAMAPALERFMQTYGSIRQNQPFKRDDLALEHDEQSHRSIVRTSSSSSPPHISVKWALGQGNWAPVPHIHC